MPQTVVSGHTPLLVLDDRRVLRSLQDKALVVREEGVVGEREGQVGLRRASEKEGALHCASEPRKGGRAQQK